MTYNIRHNYFKLFFVVQRSISNFRDNIMNIALQYEVIMTHTLCVCDFREI